MELTLKILGIIASSIAVLVPLIKWIFEKWIAAEREISDLKFKQNSDLIDRLQKDFSQLTLQITRLSTKIEHQSTEINKNNSRLTDSLHVFESLKSQIQTVQKEMHALNSKVDKMIMKQIGEDLFIVKGKSED